MEMACGTYARTHAVQTLMSQFDSVAMRTTALFGVVPEYYTLELNGELVTLSMMLQEVVMKFEMMRLFVEEEEARRVDTN